MRVLQVTDCHLLGDENAEVYGTDTFLSLQRVLKAAKSLPEPPELAFATGDLSEDGSAASYRRLRRLLLETGLPVFVLAGNHDSQEAMRRSLLGGAIRMEPHLDDGAWRIVFLDSKVEGEPHGCLAETELARLEGLVAERPERPTVVCVHHSPIRPCPSSGCHLKNDDELIAIVTAHGNVRAVVAGHSHCEAERSLAHATLFTTPATSSQCQHSQRGEPVDHEDFWASHRFDASMHGFRMLTLHADGGVESNVHWVRKELVA